jgi:hypothetical protein
MQIGTSRVTTTATNDRLNLPRPNRNFSIRYVTRFAPGITANVLIYTHVLNKGGRGVRSPADTL